jgi:mannitol/fructose-specific phosphotransferase system IIA component (Ntr-type)
MELKDLFHQEAAFFQQKIDSKEKVINFLAQKLLQAKIIDDEKTFNQVI